MQTNEKKSPDEAEEDAQILILLQTENKEMQIKLVDSNRCEKERARKEVSSTSGGMCI